MKTQYIIPAIFGLLLSISACDLNDPAPVIEPSLKALELIEADQAFAFDIFKELCIEAEEENIMISPLSIAYALSMTYNGAAGETQEAFEEVLHFDSMTTEEVNETYYDLMGSLITLDDNVEFSIANSIWYREGANVLQDFINVNQQYYDAAVRELDFSDPHSVDIINGWIEDKTNDKIKDMLDAIPAGAYMYLINAIYFNATWMYEFDPDDTFTGNFNLDDGTTSEADFMKLEGDFFYTSHEDYSAVELPYGDSAYSMVALLPAEGQTTDDLIGLMDLEFWKARKDHSQQEKVMITLPKFKYGFKSLLNEPLIDLGLGVAFGGNADFSNITLETDLYISRVIHQTFIDVMEEGTEAAAATIVELRENAVQQAYIRFDRPFIYLIKENSTGAIMFMGKVGKPEYKED